MIERSALLKSIYQKGHSAFLDNQSLSNLGRIHIYCKSITNSVRLQICSYLRKFDFAAISIKQQQRMVQPNWQRRSQFLAKLTFNIFHIKLTYILHHAKKSI